MFCFKCGSEIKEEDLFCPKCGTRQMLSAVGNEKVESIEAEISVPNKSKKKIIIIGITAIVAILAIVFLVMKKHNRVDEKGSALPKLTNIESELNTAFAMLFEGTGVNVDKIQDFQIEEQKETTHDKAFSCNAFNGNLTVMGLAKGEDVIQVQTVLLTPSAGFDSLEDSEKKALVGVALFPASIFDDEIKTLDDFNTLINALEEVENTGISGDTMRYVKDDIEYTMVSGYSYSRSAIIISVNIRYLPAFSCGYFEEDEEENIEINSNNTIDAKEDFLKSFHEKSNGYWVDMDSINYAEYGAIFDFYAFTEEELYFATYCGHKWLSGKVVDADLLADNMYKITIFYPEVNDVDMDYYCEEYTEEWEVCFDNNTFYLLDDPNVVYTYAGETLDEAASVVEKLCKGLFGNVVNNDYDKNSSKSGDELNVEELFLKLLNGKDEVDYDDSYCEGIISIYKNVDEYSNIYYTIVGRGFSGFNSSDCVDVVGNIYYFHQQNEWFSTYYKIEVKEDYILIYYGDSQETCTELCGQIGESEESLKKKNAEEEAKKLFSGLLGQYEDIISGETITIRTEEGFGYNSYASYAIEGKGFETLYDTWCAEAEDGLYHFDFVDIYYIIRVDQSGEVTISSGPDKEDCNTICGSFRIASQNDKDTSVKSPDKQYNENTETHTHAWSSWNASDNSQHYSECICGEKRSEG